MAVITLRTEKGSALTNQEADGNFVSLNTAKVEIGGDLGGTPSNPIVERIRSYLITPVAPANNQVLVFSSSSNNVIWGDFNLDLTTSSNATSVSVNPSAGNSAVILGANSSTAGLMTTESQTFTGNKIFSSNAVFSSSVTVANTITTNNITATGSLSVPTISSNNITASGSLTVSNTINAANVVVSGSITANSINITSLGIDGNGVINAQVVNAANNITTTDLTVTGTFFAQSFTVNGTITALEFNALSDITYKENITEIDSEEILNMINAISFTWKTDGNKSYGVIAQELENVMPELVNSSKETKYVNYLPMIAILIDGYKKMLRRVEELEKKI